jgi:membrane protein implicated in regulation of membrane protease activity
MQPEPTHGHARTLRLAAVGAALIVLLALVAFASHSGFGHTTTSQVTPSYVSWAMSVFFILFVLMIPVAAWAYSVQMREFKLQNRNQRSMQARILRSFAIIAVIIGLFALRQFARSHGILPAFNAPWMRSGKGRDPNAVAANHYNPTFQWPVLWVTLVLLAVVVGFLWWQWRKRLANAPLDEDGPQTLEQDVVETISYTIDDLEAEPDARRAVIAAYARMESVLGRHGLRRDPSDTAVEYLRRILLGLTSRRDAVTSLTSLFERAKFSAHEIDGSMKQEAISALRAIRDDLQAAPA